MLTEQVLELNHITKYYGAKLVLDDVSLAINREDRIGLVGENGTGKTTLAQIIMGMVEPDGLPVQLPEHIEIGYLPQEAVITEEMSVQQFFERSMRRLDQMRGALEAMENEMGVPDLSAVALNALLERYGQLQEEFARWGGYDLDYRLDQVFGGLDLNYIDRQRPVQTLSGGEKTRVLLAGLLLSSADLLVLDEPTNHLDFAALEWLEAYLLTYPGAVLLISHDRHFLNAVVTQIIELSPADHKLTIYHGDYDYYLAERERIRCKQMEAYEAQQDELKTLRKLLKAKTYSMPAPKPMKDSNKMSYDKHGELVEKHVRREIGLAKRRVDEILADPVQRPVQRWKLRADFAPDELVSREIIKLSGVSKGYGERTLIENATATVSSGDRIVFYGPNGLGKTTLVKLILGEEMPDSGEIKLADAARIGYLDQQQESLDPALTVYEAYSRDLTGSEGELRADLHKYGLFSEEEVYQKVGSLSVGQKRKLQIARLIASKANVLLLDEPTNHLDLESVEQFEQALCEFPGTVLAISHDRVFIERVATITWTLEDARLVVNPIK